MTFWPRPAAKPNIMPNTAHHTNGLADIRSAWESRSRPAAPWPWLTDLQQQALDAFAHEGFPSTRLEDWKYTDMRAVADAYPKWLATPPSSSAESPALLNIDNAIHIAFVDGRYCAERSGSAELPDEILVGNLAELEITHRDSVQSALGKLAPHSGFVAMNTAFVSDVAAIMLPDHMDLARPVYISFFTSTPEISVQPRLLIDLGAHSRATIIEHYSSSVPSLVNAVSEIDCADGSNLTWYKLQDEGTDSWHTAVQYARLARNATITTTQVDIGAQLARNELHLSLAGSGAHAECTGLFMADASRHIDSRITVEHAAPATTSRERFRGILAGKARGVFNGRILVQAEAQKTAAELTNRNLLLNPGAEVDTKPELEIYADDVKCAHGSTTGQLDKTSLFYLLSRGIEAQEARNLLIRAFAAELLTGISIPDLQDRTQAALEALETAHV